VSERDYVATNRDLWTRKNAAYTGQAAARAWSAEFKWGLFGPLERELGLLGDVTGLDVIELGCGTAFDTAWFARQGARPVGVDVTPAQLKSARRMQAEVGLSFPLIEANAEDVPLPDASFDLVVSFYGASIWCDPFLWIPEAHRLLRPGGRLVFMCEGPLVLLCALADEDATSTTLQRPQLGMRRFDWPDGEVGFHLGHGDMFRVLRESGFEVVRLVELFAADDAETHPYYSYITADWARNWPAEEIWVARKPA